MVAGYLDRTAFGYSNAFDLLALQRAADVLDSITISNQTMFGVQNIVIEDGTGISKEEIERGMNIIKIPPGGKPPLPLNLVPINENIPRNVQYLRQSMERLSGVNAVTRGQPDKEITAGNAMALLQAQTIAFSNQLQVAYIEMREKAALSCIDIIRKNLPVQKQIAISGMLPGQFISSFSAGDLEGVSRVILDLGNPSTKTSIGKRAMADALLQYGAIKDPQMYLQIATTGNLEVGTEALTFENILLKDHEEKLLKGTVPQIIWTDNNARFIQMALNLLNTPAIREDDRLAPIVLQYIQNHIDQAMNTDPMKLAAIGRQPLVPPGMQGPPPGPQGPPPQGPPPQGSPQQVGEISSKTAQPSPGIPPGQRMPTNPSTGKEFNPNEGK
jgi:hypothetical protein